MEQARKRASRVVPTAGAWAAARGESNVVRRPLSAQRTRSTGSARSSSSPSRSPSPRGEPRPVAAAAASTSGSGPGPAQSPEPRVGVRPRRVPSRPATARGASSPGGRRSASQERRRRRLARAKEDERKAAVQARERWNGAWKRPATFGNEPLLSSCERDLRMQHHQRVRMRHLLSVTRTQELASGKPEADDADAARCRVTAVTRAAPPLARSMTYQEEGLPVGLQQRLDRVSVFNPEIPKDLTVPAPRSSARGSEAGLAADSEESEEYEPSPCVSPEGPTP